MTKRQKALVLDYLDEYAKLARRNCTPAEWIAFKLSCTLAEAEKMIAAAEKQKAAARA